MVVVSEEGAVAPPQSGPHTQRLYSGPSGRGQPSPRLGFQVRAGGLGSGKGMSPVLGQRVHPQNTFQLRCESLSSERHHWARSLCHNMSTHSPELLDRVRCSVSLHSVYKGKEEGGPASETAPGGTAEIKKVFNVSRGHLYSPTNSFM